MKDVNIFIPEPGNTRAILAVSTLARAMKEANKVAILRCVWRQGQGNVVVGVLTPNISDRDNIVSLQVLICRFFSVFVEFCIFFICLFFFPMLYCFC